MYLSHPIPKNPKLIFAAMAQLERAKRSLSLGSSKDQRSPTFEMVQKADETDWSISPRKGSSARYEEWQSPTHNNKKSLFSMVKEKAKKLRHSLSGRKNAPEIEFDDESTKPTLTCDDPADDCNHHLPEEGVDDAEYLGAPMYESEAAPENLKETARQHPRASPVVSKNHRIPNRENSTETINALSTSKLPELTTISTSEPQETSVGTSVNSGRNLNQCPSCSSPQTQDKGGASMKEYVTSFFWQDGIGSKSAQRSNSLPAAARASGISNSAPPAKSHSSKHFYASTANSSSRLKHSANANEVLEEENHGKILQTN